MSDLIDRQAAIDAVYDLPNCYNGYSDTYDKACIIGVLEELPSVSQTINVTLDEDKVARVVEHQRKMQERKKGKWIETNIKGLDYVYCSECQDTYYPVPLDEAWNYCPHCGADMRGEEE